MLASCELPKITSDFDMALFSTFLDQWEIPGTSLGTYKNPSDFDMVLFLNFPGSIGSSGNFRKLPWELPKIRAGKLGTSQNPFGF